MAPAARRTSVPDAAEKAARARGYPSLGRLVIDASSDVPAPALLVDISGATIGEAEARLRPRSARPSNFSHRIAIRP